MTLGHQDTRFVFRTAGHSTVVAPGEQLSGELWWRRVVCAVEAAVQCSTVQYSTVQYSTVHYVCVQCVQCVQLCAVVCSCVQLCAGVSVKQGYLVQADLPKTQQLGYFSLSELSG